MADVTLTIDGKRITVPAGTTVLQAARNNGIFIPTLCHDPKLTPWGGCRLCVVEIEGMRGLPASCVTTVAEGMVVQTASPQVVEARKMMLELLLANHPQDCLTCSKSGACSLQDYAYYYGVRGDKFHGEKHDYPLEDDNPFIVRDMNKCILCGKCIRVCAEVQVNNVIDFAHRGFNTRVTPAMDLTLRESEECVFCGNCVQVCPVGALVEKASLWQGREWELTKVRTTCTFCGVGCNLEVSVKDDHVVRVRGYDNPLVNSGWLCVKGRFGADFAESPDRITRPLIRVGERGEGRFREATWDEALDYTARRLQEIKEQYGSRAIAALSSARCTNEENYLMQKFMRAVIGTNNVDHCART
ncbi:NADPH-Fe(3+) oxidoreductase subunit alpha [Neomoorella glycerini]|uniref:NADPH-Fe(3+) oxidoreductase subunit alpha n=2 Tax=Neomoorella glycerini TaxID=55779 RepID=A0A6I5ZP26_9FIRM|nr:NADPH-Fe(3+) oxidoreductase subunit alpha [Moorella glycerini]